MVRGKPSNRKPLAQSGWAMLHQGDDQVVADEAASVHHLLGRDTQRGTRLDRRAEHVAGGDLRDAVALADEGRLRALARAGGAQ
jgi:hypothetical protein